MDFATFRPAATTALERASMPSTCGCCGREELKRTVKMTDGAAVVWMGVGCAAKGTGVSVREVNATARAAQNEADAAEAQVAEDHRRAEQARWQAHLDARSPECRGNVLAQIKALGGMTQARVGFTFA